MSGRDEKKTPGSPDYLSDFPEEFEQHPGAPPRDLARRKRGKPDRPAANAKPNPAPASEPQSAPDAAPTALRDSTIERLDALMKRVREFEPK